MLKLWNEVISSRELVSADSFGAFTSQVEKQPAWEMRWVSVPFLTSSPNKLLLML